MDPGLIRCKFAMGLKGMSTPRHLCGDSVTPAVIAACLKFFQGQNYFRLKKIGMSALPKMRVENSSVFMDFRSARLIM